MAKHKKNKEEVDTEETTESTTVGGEIVLAMSDGEGNVTVESFVTPVEPPEAKKPKPQKSDGRLAAFMASAVVKAIAKDTKDSGGLEMFLCSDKELVRPRISSGVFILDCALGGGWQTGMIHTLYGPQSGGKTTLILRAIAAAQKLCANCYTGSYETRKCKCKDFREFIAGFIDVEGTLTANLPWAIKIGVDLTRLAVTVPTHAEQSLDVLEAWLRSGTFDLIAFDSLAFATPAKEIQNGTGAETMGAQARVVGKGIRKVVSALNDMERGDIRRRPTIFFTNQIRMKIGVLFGSPETVSAGNAPRFAASTEVRVSAGKYIIEETGLGKPTSVSFNFKVEKNKSGVAKISDDYEMCLSEVENKKLSDIFNEKDIVKIAEKLGILTGSGSAYKFLGVNYKGKAGLEAALMHDPVLYEQAYKIVMDTYILV